MSKVKLNNAEYTELQNHVDLAKKEIEEAMDDVWSTNFSNLYHNFITNGFLEDLYKDSESKYNLLFGGGTSILCGVGTATAVSGASAAISTAVTAASISAWIPVVGWIVAGVIAAVALAVGIYHFVKSASDVQFKYEAKKVFTDLLEECETGNQMNYKATENVETKLENIRLSLQNILFKIDEYNVKYADLNATAQEVGVKTTLASDGVTVLSVDTEVTIDGKNVSLSTSEALNAMFTYSNTVMSGEIAADYLSRTYGYEINYTDIVTNANAFMANTIKSGLYSHEFVNALLPEYTPSIDSAYAAITGATGVDLDKIQSTLNNNQSIAGSVALFGGLLGTALIGKIGKPESNGNGGGTSGGTPSGGSSGGGSYGPGGGSGGTSGGTTPDTNPTPVDPKPDEEEPKEPEQPEENVVPEPSNEIEIDPIVETELPEEVEFEINPDGEVDYDELARDQFEFDQEYEELIAHRSEIIEDIERKFDMGDLDSIREELKEYGYSSAEIEMIIQDRHKTIKAIIQGDQDAQMAQIARDLAKADGIEDYESKYAERPNYDELEGYGPSERMILASEDENIVKLKDTMDEAKESYEKTVVEANVALVSVAETKKVMEDLKVKYEAEYGTDTSKWTEEAAKEYNESIKAYNTSVQKAEEQVDKMNEEKEKYTKTRKEFKEAKEEYYKKTKEEYEKDTSNVLNSNYDGLSSSTTTVGDDVSSSPDFIPGQETTPGQEVTTDGIVIDSSGVTYLDGSNPNMINNQVQEAQSIDEQIKNALTADGNNK